MSSQLARSVTTAAESTPLEFWSSYRRRSPERYPHTGVIQHASASYSCR
jgi:hypothetical protein